MKRTKKAEKDIKGIVMNLSDVYEVEFTENAGNGSIAKGEKKFVTLPIAVKLYSKGKVIRLCCLWRLIQLWSRKIGEVDSQAESSTIVTY